MHTHNVIVHWCVCVSLERVAVGEDGLNSVTLSVLDPQPAHCGEILPQ